MPRISQSTFECVTTQGGLFPAEFLARIATGGGKDAPDGLSPADYHLPGSERLTEAVNRSWNIMKGRWEDFRKRADQIGDGEHGTGLTRDHWLLPLFQELGFGRLQVPPQKLEIEEREYPVSHMWGGVPIHLLGIGLDIDRRTAGAAGAARMSPHSMVQEYLNRSEIALWGIVTNGYRLRLLRDNAALTRLSYVDFDLRAIFDGNHFSDFALLWLLCHQSRFEGDRPELCWLEKWTQEARKQGVRLLERLRDGVQTAIESLGTGFIASPGNQALRDKLHNGQLNTQDYYRQVLRLVYRLIFLFVAEDRDLLLLPSASAAARNRYHRYYSTRRLRELALRRAGTAHGDLWEMLSLVMRALGSDAGCHDLALPALGSFLWSDAAMPDLAGLKLSNRHLLNALRALASTRSEQERVRRVVDYRNLGAEELGSVYESLLELHPQINLSARTFSLATAAGNERKTSGSYYTPDSLVQCLLDSALEPVVDSALEAAGRDGAPGGPRSAEELREAKARAILNLKVCDPAVGSGHFLIAAAHRLAKRLAAIRSGEDEPTPGVVHTALRDVIGRCLYGVDINPMAAELCRVSLWLEAMDPGKPLSFLDHHIRVGNSLLGATPELVAAGIPDEAFDPIEGDDRAVCREAKKQNKEESTQLQLFHGTQTQPWERLGNLPSAYAELDRMADASSADIHAKESRYAELIRSTGYLNARFLYDAWCAAFVWKKCKPDAGGFDYCLTNDILRRIERNPHDCPVWMREEVRRLAAQYQFFHWHLEFPDVFQPSVHKGTAASNDWMGGFDAILANPPWEHVELKEKEWFAGRCPEITCAQTGAERKRLISRLKISEPEIHRAYLDELRMYEGISQLLGNGGRYPLCGRGRINLYAVFAESIRTVLAPNGLMGIVLPSGIATDDTTKLFFQDVVEKNSLRSLFDFENHNALFPGVHRSYKFSLFTCGSVARSAVIALPPAEFAFFCFGADDLSDPDKRFTLSPDDIELLNPNTRTCPIFRSRRDAELTKAIYRRVPVLVREAKDGQADQNPWGITFKQGLFNMTSDSHLFHTREQLERDGWTLCGNCFRKGCDEYIPMYEQNLMNLLNHRYASFKLPSGQLSDSISEILNNERLANADELVIPRYWVINDEVARARATKDILQNWFIAFRSSVRSTDYRTALFSAIPAYAVGHSVFLMLYTVARAEGLLGVLTSFIFDFSSRQSIGGENASFFIIKQLPTLTPNQLSVLGSIAAQDWLTPRILELTYTAWDLEPFAKDCGWSGPPFRWDEDRRFLLRAELDAAFFHLYLPATPEGDWKPARIAEGAVRDETDAELAALKSHFPKPRDAVAYIMDTFPIVRRKDEAKHGTYRTKDAILEIYDAMQTAIRTGQPSETRLSPPPADPSCRHPKLGIGILAYGSLISDPGEEIAPQIKLRIKTTTSFPVEFARFSGKTRGGAPTLVPHSAGCPVNAEILVLDDSVTLDEARDMLWRRERRKEGSGEKYKEGPPPNSVLVRQIDTDPCVTTVLYTDFHPEGKTAPQDPVALAAAAIASVKKADKDKDGITYLNNAIAAGIKTPLADAYQNNIFKQTGVLSLEAALNIVSCII